MKSPSPCHRRAWGRDGEGMSWVPKARFDTIEDAEMEAARLKMHVYECPHCSGYHLTTKGSK